MLKITLPMMDAVILVYSLKMHLFFIARLLIKGQKGSKNDNIGQKGIFIFRGGEGE